MDEATAASLVYLEKRIENLEKMLVEWLEEQSKHGEQLKRLNAESSARAVKRQKKGEELPNASFWSDVLHKK
jgi:hypothetical protein